MTTPESSSSSDDADPDNAPPTAPAAAESRRRKRRRRGRSNPRATVSPARSQGRVWRIIVGCLLGAMDAVFVAAVAYLCWTLVWSDSPLERVGWPILVLAVAPLPLAAGALYFAICDMRGRRIAVPMFAIVVLLGLSVQAIGTNAVTMVRWAQARPQVLAIAAHPPPRGIRQHRRFGTYWATVHANFDGTVLLEFDRSWSGLLYVPAGLPEPDHSSGAVGPEVMPRWWFYDTD